MVINLTKGQWIGISLFLSLFLVGCTPSKDDYISDFSDFVSGIETNYKTYTGEDWTQADEEYQLYVGEYYEKHEAKLTAEDQRTIGKLKAKYQTIVMKHNAKQLIDGVSDGLNQLEGIVNGVLEEINNQ
ncbi:hypothetical protein AGMMS49525_17210 [Bacteroidia bacterium]|nr:hypothetical protein AGMMS49525_17210 [Bacteroidia bacterium]